MIQFVFIIVILTGRLGVNGFFGFVLFFGAANGAD